MASDGDVYRSMSGRPQAAEPGQTTPTIRTPVGPSRDASPVAIRQPSATPATAGAASTSTSTAPTLRKKTSANLATQQLPPSAGTSPRGSRTTSPARPLSTRPDTSVVPAATTATIPSNSSTRPSANIIRSRNNSSQDVSPSRPPALSTPTSTVPSAAAIQRALSATSVPQLQLQAAGTTGPVTDAVSKLPQLQKRVHANPTPSSGDSTPQWPHSPRLKSPPPSGVRSRRNSSLSQRGKEVIAPTIHVQAASTPSTTASSSPSSVATAERKEQAREEQQVQAALTASKAPSRGPSGPRPGQGMLETVEENTPPTRGPIHALRTQNRSSDDDKASIVSNASNVSNKTTVSAIRGKPSLADIYKVGESESEGNKSDGRGRKASQDPKAGGGGGVGLSRPKGIMTSKTAYPALGSAKSRQPEGTRNMTVETETVSSIPQAAINTDRSVTGRSEAGGSLRMKPSSETIRPKKERKRNARKAPSLNNGTASSKADIFEARVASQVNEEANDSDSDETFVYESNPPDVQHRPAGRHHSRTPSGASIHSEGGFRAGVRGYGAFNDGSRRVAGKRSMKFSNNPYNLMDSPTDVGDGTVRANARHIGRLGRAGGSINRNLLYGQDSPFTAASKLRNSDRRDTRPNSPRSVPHSPTFRPTGGLLLSKKQDYVYDFDGEGADDEGTPLMGSGMGTVRNTPRRTRRPLFNSDSLRSGSIDYYGVQDRADSRWSRFGGCMFGFFIFVLVVMGAVGFLVMSNKPLYGFEISKIENVLASEQEIMLDLLVGAINPNVLSVTVTDMDVNIFAKSKYVSPIGHEGLHRRFDDSGSDSGSVSITGGPVQDPDGRWHTPGDGDGGHRDEGNDPIEGDSQTMLLGRIFRFDSALVFEGSPMKRHTHYSLGELRLGHPGNRTEAGGSDRWEKVLQYPFELILRGVLKYQLPISSRAQSAAVAATVVVHPEEGIDEHGRMWVEPPREEERWQWIEHGDAEEDRAKDDDVAIVVTE